MQFLWECYRKYLATVDFSLLHNRSVKDKNKSLKNALECLFFAKKFRNLSKQRQYKKRAVILLNNGISTIARNLKLNCFVIHILCFIFLLLRTFLFLLFLLWKEGHDLQQRLSSFLRSHIKKIRNSWFGFKRVWSTFEDDGTRMNVKKNVTT